jgi:SAM-dependent methyltransferase
MPRLDAERDFHDRQASQRAVTYSIQPSPYHLHEDEYLDHETWIRSAFARLGNLYSLDVLDYGCGHGMASVIMAKRGACVTALDLSPGYLREARRRAQANEVSIRFVQVNAERLPFADGSFDRVWGNAILHHLDLDQAGRELHRVLRPGGIAVFCEPWGENFLLNWARRRLKYPGKQRTVDEQPLRRRDLAILAKFFSHVEVEGFQFLSMLRRIMAPGRVIRVLDRCDSWLLGRWSGLQKYCRYMVLTLRR